MTDAAAASDASTTVRTRRPWSKKFTPAEIRTVINEYHAGSNTREICKKYNIGRTTLYRWIEQHDQMPVDERDITTLKIEVATLKELIVTLAVENKKLRADHDRNSPVLHRDAGPDADGGASGVDAPPQ